MKRDGNCISLWQKSTPDYINRQPSINDSTQYDVVIIGGGITGLTTALLLQQKGKKCLLAEAETLGFGTTGGTTAHLNTFFDTPYNKVIANFGEEKAKLLAQAAKDAIALIKHNIAYYKIHCDFSDSNGYIFSTNEKQDKELQKLVEATKNVNIDIQYVNSNPLPIPCIQVARVPQQAQFNPMQYLYGLADAFEDAGGKIWENCRVTDITGKKELQVQTPYGMVTAKSAIYATHIPPGVNLLHFRCAPYRSYAIAVTLKGENYPAVLGYDMHEPYHYYRTQKVDGQYYFIIGGEDHKTGHEENTEACFRRLESHARTYFDVSDVAFRWSSQYYEPADGLPYIGHLPGGGDNVYVATGYSGNGMIYGTLSALILSDLIVHGHNVYQELFNPKRIKPIAGFSNVVKEGADVVKNLIMGKLSAQKIQEIADIAAGEAKLVKYEGHIIGLYKDENHVLYAINPACTHIKCTVSWNMAEKSWDCPCHGSRFSCEGKILTAPALKDLQKILLE